MNEQIGFGVVKTSKGWYQPAYQDDEGNYILLGTEEFQEENDAWVYLREKIAPYLCIVEVSGGIATEKYVGEKATLIIKDYD